MKLLVPLGALLSAAAAALPAVAEAQRAVEVFSQAHSVLVGPVLAPRTEMDPTAGTGASVAGAGDVNGDGRPDLIVGMPGLWGEEKEPRGAAVVILGPPPPGPLTLTTLGTRGFRISGGPDDTWTGSTVDRAGDFNGDGLDDVLVTAPDSMGSSGAAYVVFGSRTTGDVDLAQLGDRGLRIEGATPEDEDDGTCDSGCMLYPGDRVGTDAAAAGDVNGDGLDDVVVASLETARAAVIFGRRSGGRVSFEAPNGGFMIDGFGGPDYMPVAGPGDVNGDGLADVLVGSDPTWGGTCGRCTGRAYLVFGKGSGEAVHVNRLEDHGLRMIGHGRREGFGYDVAGPGDVNGDGRPDLLIGTGRRAVVVFGSRRTGSLTTERLGARGFVVSGTNIAQVDRAGDWNGDGRADMAIGRRLVLAPRSARTISVKGGFRGFELENRAFCLRTTVNCPWGFPDRYYQLAGASDLNGDGRGDLVYGDATTGPGERGAAFVLYAAGPPRAAVVAERRGFKIEVDTAGRFGLRVLCPANAVRSCTGTARLITREGSTTLLRKRFSAYAGRYASLPGRLPAQVNERLRRRGQIDVIARVRARDPRGRRAGTGTDFVLVPATP
jgi:FG-GAP-like repeat/FG-GAP repeat